MRWILEEDGYQEIAEASVMVGDIILYFRPLEENPSHVGVIDRREAAFLPGGTFGEPQIWVLSKWGRDGEYRHLLTDVPVIYGDRHEFWTDRVSA